MKIRLSAIIGLLAVFTPCFHAQAQFCRFEDHQFSFEFIRTLGYSSTGGADINECLITAYRIEDGNKDSWFREWHKTAMGLETLGDRFLVAGHKISAREAYFRASGYYRTAEFFLHGNPKDSRILKTWAKSRSCFQKAIPYCSHPIKYLRIPFLNTTLPAYLCLVDESEVNRPLLIIHTGFDGTAEELYFEIGKLALKRGFNCLLFEGPGQGEMIRKQGIPFRPDWETVITPVVDYALQLPTTDTGRIGLIGISFGGYLAPRAVAFEKRIKVCVANGGIYDMYENTLKKCPPGTEKMINDENAARIFDDNVQKEIEAGRINGWFFNNGMFTFKAGSPSKFIHLLKAYSLKEHAVKIDCKMLICDSENDVELPGQAKKLYDALKCPKEYMLFRAEEGADQHCQMGAVMISGERILNWVEKHL